MTIANDILQGKMPNFEAYLSQGESLDDMDEYGFTPLIESVIAKQPAIAKELIQRGVHVNEQDVTKRTALHWAVDNDDLKFSKGLLAAGADPNAFTRAGLSVLVYPVLREQHDIKHLLYQYGGKLDFALDFIAAKLLGHRFELIGDVDILTAQNKFIEVNYEGFILEFTVAIIRDSLMRFTSSYSTRHLRRHFTLLYGVMDAFETADELLKLQRQSSLSEQYHGRIAELIKAPLLILPAASRGHAFCFVRYGEWWAKIDRGENSLKEGTVNIYRIKNPEALTPKFVHNFLYKRQSRIYFHQEINKILGLEPVLNMPLTPQITGNCSWANVQGVVAVAYAMQQLGVLHPFSDEEAMMVYHAWVAWDKDRALEECIQRFYLAETPRRASLAQMLGAVLFQSCDAALSHHLLRAEKILAILILPEYKYILDSYLKVYCVDTLTKKGNNLLKILDDCGMNPNIGVTPIATQLDGEGEHQA
ncbi:MAG: ankyrin repeat domain-containing protein [Gammaproteobacteria bacterium]|nr:ankyrin repeat domain-containing protein [Gammaproteobacteria bacterium]